MRALVLYLMQQRLCFSVLLSRVGGAFLLLVDVVLFLVWIDVPIAVDGPARMESHIRLPPSG